MFYYFEMVSFFQKSDYAFDKTTVLLLFLLFFYFYPMQLFFRFLQLALPQILFRDPVHAPIIMCKKCLNCFCMHRIFTIIIALSSSFFNKKPLKTLSAIQSIVSIITMFIIVILSVLVIPKVVVIILIKVLCIVIVFCVIGIIRFF